MLCAVNSHDGFRMADWHLAEQLSKQVPVLYVDPPRSALASWRRHQAATPAAGVPRLRVLRPGLARLSTTVQPFPARRGSVGLTSALLRGYMRRATARLGGRAAVVISGWPAFPVFGSCGEQVTVYWAKDNFVGLASSQGLNTGLLDARERRIAADADLVLAANPLVAGTWRSRGLEPVLIPFGADVDAYLHVEHVPPPLDITLPGPIAGFVGRINDRTDLRLLEAIAGRGRSLLLVGPKDPAFEPARFAALRRRANVHWVGPKPSWTLPGYLRLIDVGLVPYRDSEFNRASCPLKTLEYLAAGRAVVATDLPAIRWLDTDLICVADEPASFADQVDRLLAKPREPAVLARRQAFAARHSWACRAADIRDAIDATAGRHPRHPVGAGG